MGMMSIRKSIQRLFAPVIVILVIGLTVGMFYIGFPMTQKETWGYKGPSAEVYGKVIKDQDFTEVLIRYQQQASQYPNAYSQADLRDQALSRVVAEMAYKLEMDKAGSKVDASLQQVNDFIKKRWPTEEELQSAIQQYGQSSKSEFVNWLREQFKIRNFTIYKCRELKMTVPQEKVLASLEKITVSHILIGTNDPSGKVLRSEAEALQRANEVYQKATAPGADYAALAKEYSDDPGSKEKGGAYGPYPVEQFKTMGFVKEFVDAALALKVGQISKPVKTQFGYHILKLNDRSLPKGDDYKKELKEVEDNLLYSMTQDPNSPFTKWIQELNQKAIQNMKILDPGLRAYRLQADQKWQEAAPAYEKALQRPYYKDKIEMYLDASKVYIELKDTKKAIETLKRAPSDLIDIADYQITLAKAYKADGQLQKALDGLSKFSERHINSMQENHLKLKQLYTEWKMPDLAGKEGKIVDAITKKEEEDSKQYQENLQKQQQAAQQATPTPVQK
jgi:parvulin-like peptidyl-prolyl isomerase